MDPLPHVPVDPAEEPTVADALVVARAASLDGRRWLEAITRLLEAYSREPERDALVQTELDTLVIAACRRAKRILRADLDEG
jgi:hypothetical protein